MTNQNTEFAIGWRRWCRFGNRPAKPGPKQEGFDAAAHFNDYGGGNRPRVDEAQAEADARYAKESSCG